MLEVSMDIERGGESSMPPQPTDGQPSMQPLNIMSQSGSQFCPSSANSSNPNVPVRVKNDLIPKIGQEFPDIHHAYEFYLAYGTVGGFGVRKSHEKKNSKNVIVSKEFCCCKEGQSNAKKDQPRKRSRGETRENCNAFMKIKRQGDIFVVSKFVEAHSHQLTTPTKRQFLTMNREMSSARKALARQMNAANVAPCQQMSFFEVQSGGLENVGFTQVDLCNARRDAMKIVDGRNADLLYDYFLGEQEKNPAFVFTMEKDDAGMMTHCFWADDTARKSYTYFGDVVVFDITYKTNKYHLMFAPILGVNHHRQTTLFGCALLSDEKAETFQWIFSEWLNAMPAGPPGMIITDQDPAMTKAIAKVLPHTHHRYCMWHITNKFSEKISNVAYNAHYEEFKKCIWNSETPEEFEVGWEAVVGKANLTDNEWLKNLYEIRHRWVPAYVRHLFSAHMTSSQREEISHSFFKRYVSEGNTLYEFVTLFDRGLAKIRHNESKMDHKDVNEKPTLQTSYPMKSTMRELYTLEIFKNFQKKLFINVAYKVTLKVEEEHQRTYTVEKKKEKTRMTRELVVDKASNHVRCSCKMFECFGIPCRHLLAYLNKFDVEDLPNEFILRRWTKAAKAERVRDDLGTKGGEIRDTSLCFEQNRLLDRAYNLVANAMGKRNGPGAVNEFFELAESKLSTMEEDGEWSGIQESLPLASQVSMPQLPREHTFKQPAQVQHKGCGKRIKGGKEKATKGLRRCNGCGKIGQSHDKRNCPYLVNCSLQVESSSQVVRLNDSSDDNDDEDGDYDDNSSCITLALDSV